MARVRHKDTRIEMTVRHLVFSMGYRYRLHRKDMPGCPDLVFPSPKKAIFVNGCFWHRHQGCARTPKSNQEFWIPKLDANRARDEGNLRLLQDMGWDCLVIWECQLRDLPSVRASLSEFLGGEHEVA